MGALTSLGAAVSPCAAGFSQPHMAIAAVAVISKTTKANGPAPLRPASVGQCAWTFANSTRVSSADRDQLVVLMDICSSITARGGCILLSSEDLPGVAGCMGVATSDANLSCGFVVFLCITPKTGSSLQPTIW